MDETTTLWIFGTIVGIQVLVMGALIKALYEHVLHCRNVESSLGGISADVRRIMSDIGDHGSGIRGSVHKQRGQIGALAEQIDRVREKTGMRAIDLAEAFRRDRG